MRVLTKVLFSAAIILAPALASADPGQVQAAPGATVETAPTTMPTVTITAKTPQAAPVTAASTASDPDEVVCRTSPPTTGTRLGAARECHTQRDWDNRMKESQRITAGTQMMGLQGPLSSPGGK